MTQTHNTVPSANSSFLTDLQTFLEQEDAERAANHNYGFVVSGGTHATGAGLTHTPSALIAYTNGYYISEAGSIVYQANTTQWVIADSVTTGNLGTFARVSGTHYLLDTVSGGTQPALPSGAIWLMEIITNGTDVTTATDLRTVCPILYYGSTTTDFPTGRRGMRAFAADTGFWYEHNGTTWVRPLMTATNDPAHTHQSTEQGGRLDHGLALNGIADDDHMQYALLLGRSGGQTIIGGTASGNDLILQSTSHATKGAVRVDDAQVRYGVSTVAQITGNQNDYDPGDAGILRLSSDATRSITGISGGAAGRTLLLYNAGAYRINFPFNSGSSSAANRFTALGSTMLQNSNTAAQLTLYPTGTFLLVYDATLSLWLIFDLNRYNAVSNYALTTQVDKTNNTLASITEWPITTLPGNVGFFYSVDFTLLFSGANTTHDVKLGWSSASTIYWGPASSWDTVATGSSPTALLAFSDTYSFGSISGTFGARIHAIIVGSGNDTTYLQVAQATTDAGTLSLLPGSTMRIARSPSS